MENALELGKAAEHLVCVDLILQGYRAFLSDQGCPFDVVVDLPSGLVRVQVKATTAPRNVNSEGRNARIAYSWSVRQRGRDGGGLRLSEAHCDIIALVALDIRSIDYFPVGVAGTTVQLDLPGADMKLRLGRETWPFPCGGYPFSAAITGDPSFYRMKVSACSRGHEMTPENTYTDNRGWRQCKACWAVRSAKRVAQ